MPKRRNPVLSLSQRRRGGRDTRGLVAALALGVIYAGCSGHRASSDPSLGPAVIPGSPGGSGGVQPRPGAGASGGVAGTAASGPNPASGTAPRGGSSGMNAGAGGAGGAPTLANGYYVSPDGSDAAQGTLSAPFQTLEKARDVVRTVNGNLSDDIHVYLRGGTYRVAKTIAFGAQDSGTNGHRIIYEAYPNETPILNGAVKVSGWTQSSGNVYKASLLRSAKLRNLYVNDTRALMTSKKVTATGGYGSYSVTAGQASWAWASGSQSDGAKYSLSDVPSIANNKDDLEIVNATTWNENIVCVRDVITTPDNARALLFQQPYGAIAQLPGWGAAFAVTGPHTIYNAFELLNAPGEFYFDKSGATLYYIPRPGEDMTTADVEAPLVETLIEIAGDSTTNRVHDLAFRGITFANTDYNLVEVGSSRGKASVQGATVFIAYGDGNYHNSQYRIIDTLPSMIHVTSAESIEISGNVVEHSGSEGISFINDVVDSSITGNYVTDIAGSGITIGHPQHVYIGDGGDHEKYPPGVEGVCKNDRIANNVLSAMTALPGFGGHAGITAFFVDTLTIEHNHIQGTAYNGINLGWGWRNFPDSTTCRGNSILQNRLFDTMQRLHDSGAVYTIGQMPGTQINQNYVKGIPPATTGPTYGLHNDEGSAYIVEDDNVLDIDPGVKYTINSEDFGAKHDLTILRTFATVNKMGATPPNSVIDPPVAVPDNVWPAAQYQTCLAAGVEEPYRSVLPTSLMSTVDYVFPASCSVPSGTSALNIRSSGDASNTVWLAPAGTTSFAEGPNMTKTAGDRTSIAVPTGAGTYKLVLVDGRGSKLGESAAVLRVK
jgi:hypothetical protein